MSELLTEIAKLIRNECLMGQGKILDDWEYPPSPKWETIAGMVLAKFKGWKSPKEVEEAVKQRNIVWIKALMRGGIAVSKPEQLEGISGRIREQERERIIKLADKYVPARFMVSLLGVLKNKP